GLTNLCRGTRNLYRIAAARPTRSQTVAASVLPDVGCRGGTMRQSLSYLATVATLAIAYRSAISPAAIVTWPRRLTTPALAPIEAFVDWLEAAYGGPLDTSSS